MKAWQNGGESEEICVEQGGDERECMKIEKSSIDGVRGKSDYAVRCFGERTASYYRVQ